MKKTVLLSIIALAALTAAMADENYACEAELPSIDALIFKSEGSLDRKSVV